MGCRSLDSLEITLVGQSTVGSSDPGIPKLTIYHSG
jgi:hypothetical protein